MSIFNVSTHTVVGNMKRLSVALPLKVAAALYQEGLKVQADSMRRTPVDTGTLKASHETSLPSYRGDFLEVTISVGGAAKKYAVPVHERLDVKHPNGEAKFLQNAVDERADSMLTSIGNALRLGATL